MKTLLSLFAIGVIFSTGSLKAEDSYSVAVAFRGNKEVSTLPVFVTKTDKMVTNSFTVTEKILISAGEEMQFTTGQGTSLSLTTNQGKMFIKGEAFHAEQIGETMNGTIPVVSTRTMQLNDAIELGATKRIEMGKDLVMEVLVNKVNKAEKSY